MSGFCALQWVSCFSFPCRPLEERARAIGVKLVEFIHLYDTETQRMQQAQSPPPPQAAQRQQKRSQQRNFSQFLAAATEEELEDTLSARLVCSGWSLLSHGA
jgi:hypothetical protein